ncbi:MAG: NAD(P)/FAD-dependent oxidoreductase [Candidatus Korobacteraceae bacterium]
MNELSEVAIVGAGPYGLSIAAHLQAAGLSFRIFGSPMQSWREHMPPGMLLKSDGFASSLSDPKGSFTLRHFCAEQQIPYHDTRIPVRLETFTAYGLEFQKRFVPQLEQTQVMAIDRIPGGFSLKLAPGEVAAARNVVLAVGISHFHHVPPNLSDLPAQFLSHSSAHSSVEQFRGRNVTVLGGGSSAADLAAILSESGAHVTLLARCASLRFHTGPAAAERSLWERLRRPTSGLGPGLRSRFFADFPWLFRHLPQDLRLRLVRTTFGPAGGWTVKERILGRVPMMLGYTVQRADVLNDQVRLLLTGPHGSEVEHLTGHVIAATGYRVDLRRLTFLSAEISSQLRVVEHTPVVSTDFQSSEPGLFFVGVAAANSFGPVLRFTFGADFTARRVANALQRSARSGVHGRDSLALLNPARPLSDPSSERSMD